MIRRLLAVVWVVHAGCDKPEATAAKTLAAAPRLPSGSYDEWCSRLTKGTCKGEWEGHLPGSAALGTYRFVVVEYSGLRDGEGNVRDVHLELKNSRGVTYFLLGRTRPGKVVTSLQVREIIDHPGALELRTVSRTSPRFTYADYHGATLIVEGPKGLGVMEFALGKIVGNNEGATQGTVGELKWQSGKVNLKGTGQTDGEWAISPP